MIRILGAGDEAALDAFLARHADSSMFLRSNARSGGLVDHGQPLQAAYAGAFGPALEAVAAHCWNGMLLVQAPALLDEVVRAAVKASRRTVTGIAGPWAQAQAAAEALSLRGSGAREVLYALDLATLAFAPPPELRARRPRLEELEMLTDWREAYLVETGLARPGPELRGMARAGVALHHAQGNDWVLERTQALVAYTAFNARLPDVVQVGGVWTPPHLRAQGLARAAVATHLLSARGEGARRAVLFTAESNRAARRAYESLGFRVTGDYGLVAV